MGIGNTINNMVNSFKDGIGWKPETEVEKQNKNAVPKFRSNLPKLGEDDLEGLYPEDRSMVRDLKSRVNFDMVTLREMDQCEKDLDPRKGFVDVDRSCGPIHEHGTLSYEPETEKAKEYKSGDSSFKFYDDEHGEYAIYSGKPGSFVTQEGRIKVTENNSHSRK